MSSWWTQQSECYELWDLSKRVGNNCTGLKRKDNLTITGVGLNAVYGLPDTANYRSYDTDFAWWKTNGDLSTTDGNRLIGYDLQGTPVKYDDLSPNTPRYIMILSSAVTGTKRDRLFRDMHLPVLWDNNLNGYGRIKSNRTGQNLWTPESVYVLHDTFTDIDNAHLNDHTMNIGAGWSVTIGNEDYWIISGNKVVYTEGSSAQEYAFAESGKSDNDISIDITIPAGNTYSSGLVFRYQDSTHKWTCFYEKDNTTTCLVYMQKDGVTQGSPIAVTIPSPGDVITLKVLTSGNSIKSYVNGVLKHNITDATYNNKTLVGLFKYRDVNYIDAPEDNFKVI
jgi:hypothetical protein